MTDSEMLSVLVGALLPFVLSLVIRAHWDSDVKAVLAFLACVPAGLATAYFAGSLSFADSREVSTDVLVVAVAAYSFYNGFYKHVGENLPAVKLPFKIVSANSESAPAVAGDASQFVPAPVEPSEPAAPEAPAAPAV